VSNCFEEFWREYSNENLAKVLKNFPKTESALYGLLREGSERYRDHYIHMFNNFIFGGQVLTLVASKCDRDAIGNFFKIQAESDMPICFTPYSEIKRLFFLWTLITNFHDLGVGIERVDDLIRGLNYYLSYFGYKITHFNLVHEHSLEMEAPKYLQRMASFYTNGIRPSNGIYETPSEANPYIYRALCDAFDKHDQGIMAAIGLFRNIEETFFKRDDALALKFDEFALYYERVLIQDIARAGLAIALHSLKPTDYPLLFPISFKRLPISFLFVLCDEVAEFFRPEGITYDPITKLRTWPKLHIEVFPDRNRIRIQIEISYKQMDGKATFVVLEQVAEYFEEKRLKAAPFTSKEVADLKEKGNKGLQCASDYLERYFTTYWDERERMLRSKLELGPDSEISLTLIVKMPVQPAREIQKTYLLGWR
jgi:hypothetical protein